MLFWGRPGGICVWGNLGEYWGRSGCVGGMALSGICVVSFVGSKGFVRLGIDSFVGIINFIRGNTGCFDRLCGTEIVINPLDSRKSF